MLSKEIHSGRFCECKIHLQSNSLRGLIFVHIITPNKPKLASLVVGSGLALFSCCSIRRRYEVWLLSLFLFSFLFLNYSPVDLKGHHKQAAFHKSHTQNRAESCMFMKRLIVVHITGSRLKHYHFYETWGEKICLFT